MSLKRLKELRKEMDLTQEEVADSIEISRQRYYQYEIEKYEPDIDTLKRLAQFFHVSVDYLIGNIDTRYIPKPDELNKLAFIESLPEDMRPLLDKLTAKDLELLDLIHLIPGDAKDALVKLLNTL